MTKGSGANTTNCGARLINPEKNITKLELILQTTLHSWLSMTGVWLMMTEQMWSITWFLVCWSRILFYYENCPFII